MRIPLRRGTPLHTNLSKLSRSLTVF